MLNPHRRVRMPRGFTLIELSVVVVVVALLLGSLLYPLSAQVQQRNVSTTQASLDEAREALIGFAMTNGRLPCPDINGDGLEDARAVADAATEGCQGGVYQGWLPWATLGVGRVDAWGYRFKYRVTNEFTRRNGDASALPPCSVSGADPNSCTLQLGDTGSLQVSTKDPNSKAPVPLASSVPAAIISLGRNGYGATNQDGVAQPAPPAVNVDEQTNVNAATTTFISRTESAPRDTCSDTVAAQPFCEFDDQVVWVSINILFSRMVAAGRLP